MTVGAKTIIKKSWSTLICGKTNVQVQFINSIFYNTHLDRYNTGRPGHFSAAPNINWGSSNFKKKGQITTKLKTTFPQMYEISSNKNEEHEKNMNESCPLMSMEQLNYYILSLGAPLSAFLNFRRITSMKKHFCNQSYE